MRIRGPRVHPGRGFLVIALHVCLVAAGVRGVGAQPSTAGAGLLRAGQYDQAVASARERLAALEPVKAAAETARAEAIEALAEALCAAGSGASDETRLLAERAVKLAERRLPRDAAVVARAQRLLAAVLVWRGDFPQAVDLYRRALVPLDKTPPRDAASLARTLDGLGEALTLDGRYGEAVDVLTRAVAVRSAEVGDSHPDVATSLEHLAAAEMRHQRLASAREHLQRALTIRQTHDPGDPRLAYTFDVFGDLLWFEGNLTEAEAWSARAVGFSQATLGPLHPDVAVYLRNYAATTNDLGFPERARASLGWALRVAEVRLGSSHPEVARILNGLAVSARRQGDYLDARRFYERALRIGEQRFGATDFYAATLLHNLAILCDRLGDTGEAIRLERRALNLWTRRQGARGKDVGRASSALAGFYVHAGRLREARTLYTRALAIRERSSGPKHREVATTLADLAVVLMRLGQTNEAWTRLSRAMAIWAEAGAPDDFPYLVALATRGQLEAARGEMATARATLREALDAHERVLGTANPDVATLRVTFGELLADAGAPDEALRQALEAEGAGRAHLQLTMRDLSERLALGYAAARPKGLDLAASIVAHRPPGSAGDAALVLDELIQSRGLVLDEMAARNRTSSARDAEGAPAREALAYARQRLANLIVRGPEGLTPERYAAVLDQARTRKEEAERAAAETSAELRKELARSHVTLTGVRAALRPGEALVSFLRFDDCRRRPASAPTALARAGAVPASAHSSEAASAFESGSAPMSMSAPAAGSATGTLRGPTAARPDAIAAAGSASAPLSAATRSPTPMLSRCVPTYVAFVLRGDAPDVTVVPIGAARDVEAEVARWRDEVRSGLLREHRTLATAERAVRAAGLALRRRIWDPVAAPLQDVRRVFLVPDGALNLVSFAALPLETRTPAFVVEQGPTLHYLSAERDLVRSETIHAGSGLLALGAPTFGTVSRVTARGDAIAGTPASPPAPALPSSAAAASASAAASPLAAAARTRAAAGDCVNLQTMWFDALPGSREEIQAVGRIWQAAGRAPRAAADAGADAGVATDSSVELLVRAAAQERAFKARAPGRRVLHLATHGFFLGGPCQSSASAPGTRAVGGLAGVGPQGAGRTVKPIDNPLMLSGLAFAGANRRARARADEDDGILTAEEVTGLNLEGVEWAVLSACDTGIGAITSGEGVFGLRRAFQIAGVRTVILSLWAVEDRSAVDWMRALYDERRRAQLDTADAVRAASLDVLHQRRARGESVHPFFWAGFVATGDWR